MSPSPVLFVLEYTDLGNADDPIVIGEIVQAVQAAFASLTPERRQALRLTAHVGEAAGRILRAMREAS